MTVKLLLLFLTIVMQSIEEKLAGVIIAYNENESNYLWTCIAYLVINRSGVNLYMENFEYALI